MNLANKYRPKVWAEVVGQNHIISVLSKQVNTNKIKQAYLFVGGAGSGKTSTARIFATSLNGKDYEPIEIDAASNNGVDDVRGIIADAGRSPLGYSYNIYIIDECQQFSKQAWDAALKLIEEPPSSAIFIFCTTNPSKIPDTIISRVQRFDFYKVKCQDICDRLAYILNVEFGAIPYDESALISIAIQSDGSLRQAIQLLDRCLDSCADKLSNEVVNSVLGKVSFVACADLLNYIQSGDISMANSMVESIKLQSPSFIQFYDLFLNILIQYNIYLKTGSINYCNIPSYVFNSIRKQNDFSAYSFMERLVLFRSYITDDSTAEQFLLLAILEMCKR